MSRLTDTLQSLFKPSEPLTAQLEQILGFRPKHLAYYQLALAHSSHGQTVQANNERLEYLGDAILGAVVAEYLFKKYPNEAEGFLTEMRSRMVRRESLNEVSLKMGLNKLLVFNHADKSLNRSHIFGNALEALVGAIYLDQGYTKTRSFIVRLLIRSYMDVEQIETTDTNYKNQLLNWAQRNHQEIEFIVMDDNREGARKVFTIGVFAKDKQIAMGTGYSKKAAGQDAAHKALLALGIDQHD
ncbi:MAG: ribonuclease III [Bacteroidetes bacterium]|nr:ribonuclease III [Bacteroidota bacterium]MBS1747567.1 ribonuclease III [Bacteroidota bacterium]